ncbi:MAG: DUF5695 domain-containing protein, partial [Terriglobales bacterium]
MQHTHLPDLRGLRRPVFRYAIQDASGRRRSFPSIRHFRWAGGLLALALLGPCVSAGAQYRRWRRPAKPGPMLAQGIEHLQTPGFRLDLVRSSQTVAALQPKGAGGFDFTPSDWLVRRSRDGYYQLGDIDLRLRVGPDGAWQNYSTAYHREPVQPLPIHGDELAAADLAPTLPASIPVTIVRTWRTDGDNLALHFKITNKSSRSVTI